jgi:lipopolysaccharide biosynthesis glycosyltransferase
MNKPTTLLAAEEISDTQHMLWLDADMLVIDEPTELAPGPDEDFTACAADKNAGTAGPDDPFESYWREMARHFGLQLDDLPWVITEREKARIRIYFNAGLFGYRRSSKFAKTFMERCRELLHAKVKSASQGIILTDQIALGLTMISMKMRWRPLSRDYNFSLGRKQHEAGLYDPLMIKQAKILHYHDAMWPHFRQQFLTDLRSSRPDVADWLAPQPVLANDLALPWKLYGKALGIMRKRKYLAYESQCKPF